MHGSSSTAPTRTSASAIGACSTCFSRTSINSSRPHASGLLSRPRRTRSRRASAKSLRTLPKDERTVRSAHSSASRRRPCASTSRTRTRSSAYTRGRAPSRPRFGGLAIGLAETESLTLLKWAFPADIENVEAAEQSWRPLGELLVDKGLVTEDELARALKEQQETEKLLGAILVDRGFVSGPALAIALAEQYGVELEGQRGFGTGLWAEIDRRHRGRPWPPAGGQRRRAGAREGSTARGRSRSRARGRAAAGGEPPPAGRDRPPSRRVQPPCARRDSYRAGAAVEPRRLQIGRASCRERV